MRQRRSSPNHNNNNNRNFRRPFNNNHKPRRLQGLPADEPELPLHPPTSVTAPAEPATPSTSSVPSTPSTPAVEVPAPTSSTASPEPVTNQVASFGVNTPTEGTATITSEEKPEKPKGRFFRGRFSKKKKDEEATPKAADSISAQPELPIATAPANSSAIDENSENSPALVTAPALAAPPPVPLPPGPHLELDELQQKSARQLRVIARDYTIENAISLKKHELIVEIIKRNFLINGTANGGGILDLDRDGYGFLRSSRFNYLEKPEDVYVSPTQIRRYNLRRGEWITGPIRPPKDKERYFALGRVDKVDGQTPEENRQRPQFDLLTPMFPNRRIFLEGTRGDVSMRAMDLICPLGFGQRGLIVAPPRTGKTILLQKIANAVMENNPQAHLIMLLIDERPEEVTDMLRTVKGEVLASTFDESPARHVAVAEMVMERAKRLVENKVDVVILLDSITRLARAYNTQQPSSGKIMSGGIEAGALQKPKRFFGAARNVQEGGSLTIIATALVDTGSRADDLIFEEFKGTGNMEVSLDRNLSDQRIFPAFNIQRSGTRKEELLYHPDEQPRIHALRRMLVEESAVEAMSLLLEKINKTQNNIEFLMQLKVT